MKIFVCSYLWLQSYNLLLSFWPGKFPFGWKWWTSISRAQFKWQFCKEWFSNSLADKSKSHMLYLKYHKILIYWTVSYYGKELLDAHLSCFLFLTHVTTTFSASLDLRLESHAWVLSLWQNKSFLPPSSSKNTVYTITHGQESLCGSPEVQ